MCQTGCFGFKFGEDGRALELAHRSGYATKLPEHVVITRQFELVSNWSDKDAIVELKPVSFSCYALLPEDCELRKRIDATSAKPKAFYSLCERMAGKYEDERAAAKVGQVQTKDEIIKIAKQTRLKLGAEKARAARTAKAKANSKKRRASLLE